MRLNCGVIALNDGEDKLLVSTGTKDECVTKMRKEFNGAIDG